ncbi:MAG: hypothetical protein ROM54_10140 [Anaerobiospirillum sp.]|nr:hypothetical protein [Anaerobiospirillum sp.]
MTETNLRTIFYALPLPLSNPSINARLAGLALMSIGDGLSLDAPNFKRLITCKLADHALISPSYLLRQGIDPNNLQHGLTALNFMRELEQVLAPKPQDILVTFAARHLSVYNAMALQNFFEPNLFARFPILVDLKVALDICYYFGTTRVKTRKSLPEAVRALGYSGGVDNKLERLDALYFLYNYLNRHDPKIMAFIHSCLSKRIELVRKAPFLVYIDEAQGQLHLIKVLSQSADGRLVKAVVTDGAQDSVQVINLDLAPLIAPTGILTQERQVELKFDLAALKARLDQVEVSELTATTAITPEELPFYDAFRQSLSGEEQAQFERLMSHDVRQESNLTALCNPETKLGQITMCYLNENFPKALMAGERSTYARYCRRLAESRSRALLQELRYLADQLPEDDSKQGELLMRIASFF